MSDKLVPGRERLIAAIRGAGLRATASRVAVLDRLHRANRPMSHAEIVDALRSFTWDRSTLYRNLNDLAEAGLARRSEIGDRTWRFEVLGDSGHADHIAHFHCRQCGYIACLPEVTVAPTGNQALPLSLLRGDVEVQVLGKCDSCFNAI